MAKEQKLSFKLDSFTAGGALPDGPYMFSESQVVEWDYDGKLQGSTVAYRCSMIPLDGKGNEAGSPLVQHWSIGDPAKIGPSPDGLGIVSKGRVTTLGKGSNFYLFLENLIANAGFPADKYDNDVSVFDGLQALLVNIPQPKRTGLPKSNLLVGAQEQERERTIPVVKEIIKLPWEKGRKVSPTKAAGGRKEESTGGGNEPLAVHLGAILEKNPKGVDRTQARVQLFRSLRGDDALFPEERDAALASFTDDDALGEVLGAFGFELASGGKKIQPS